MSIDLKSLKLTSSGSLVGGNWKLSVRKLGMRKTLSVVRLHLHVEGTLSLDQWKKVKPLISEQLKAYQKEHKTRTRWSDKQAEKTMVSRMVVSMVERELREHRNHCRRQTLRQRLMKEARERNLRYKFEMVRDCACPNCNDPICYWHPYREERRARAQLRKLKLPRRAKRVGAPIVYV